MGFVVTSVNVSGVIIIKLFIGISEKKNFKVSLKTESTLSSQIVLRIAFHYIRIK